jgi:response regulator RpfG family c-di-GMP phosphodiesterase
LRDAQAGAAVLVVDADTRERSAVRGMLARLDYRIAGAESQADALRAVAHERFAVIVMDTRREALDGYETAKRIREQTGTELTPIIFLTAFGDDELETAAAYASGAMRSQQLEDSVESIMELNSALVDTTVGAEMLSGSTFDLVAMAEEIALTHHEKWDGSGYPAGLSGDAIPITGRIVAVADVFDALTHVRPYKPAWSFADADAELRSQTGRHFDPQVVDAFFSARREPRLPLAGALL